MRRFEGKTAIVTGAGSGIGRRLVERLAEEGARVLASDMSGQERDVAAAVGDAVHPFHCDVSNVEDVEAMVAEAITRFGAIDILCNNAGISGTLAPLHECSIENWDQVIGVNLRATFLGMKFAIPHMLRQGGGVILNTASIGSTRATPLIPAYNASKGGVLMLTRQAAVDYAKHNIRINAICPTTVETPMILGAPKEVHDLLVSRIPMGRLATIDEVVAMHLFLASDEASFLTGCGYMVDGGASAWQ